jgi:aldose 1-epimerase
MRGGLKMSVEKEFFGALPDGREVYKYILKNTNGMSAEILTFGCRIYRLFAPDRNGKSENVVLGHRTLAEYNRDDDFFGAVVGRCANRIAGAEFKIGESTYHLAKNEGKNSLHSAPGGYQSRVWEVEKIDGSDISPSITLSCLDKDGECGFPGNVTAKVTYSLSSDNALTICYTAQADRETPFMPTNHTFFNLTGIGKTILPLTLKVNAGSITETDNDLIPTGKFIPVKGTPFDFSTPKPIGKDIFADEPFLKTFGGFDNNFALKGLPHQFKEAAVLYDSESGRKMRVLTDMPGLQVFTANSYHKDSLGYDGEEMENHHAVCLETQFFPDSVHHAEFPFENLKPGSKFKSITSYQFTAE